MHRYSREYYLKTQAQTIQKRRDYRRDNRDKIRAQQRVWYKNKKAARNALKLETLSHYSNGEPICTRCGYSDIRALTLDHIIPIGRKERRVTGLMFYRVLQRQGYPEGYQTLCANCQMLKMFEGNEWQLNT